MAKLATEATKNNPSMKIEIFFENMFCVVQKSYIIDW